MRLLFKIALLLAGVALILWCIKPFTLLMFGDQANGVIVAVVGGSVTTEMVGGRRSVSKPSGFFTVKTKVRYTFDILPTPLEELQRLSEAPIATGVKGSDTLYGKTRFSDIAMWSAGDTLPVIYLKKAHWFNAAYQPRSMTTLGTIRLIGGLGLLLWGLLFKKARYKKARTTDLQEEVETA